MKKQNVRTLSLIVATLTYLLIGAAIFDKIESGEEQNQALALRVLEDQILDKYNFTQADFLLMEEIVLLYKPYKAGKPWKFAGSFYYATTVLTTIGYGHSTPKTTGGKIFTMIYATIGIPLGLVMFNSIGERLNKFSSLVINSLRRSLKTKQEETTEVDLILVVMVLSAIIMGVGAWAFSHYENWSYFDAMYYCFITLTTIGFGDLVALQQDNALEEKPEYVTFALFFIMFGLAVIAAVLNLMVLKFMTMNTEDEKRDEIEAIQAAAQAVRVEGDVIMSNILNDAKYRELTQTLSTSADDMRSICSCNCMSCNPFSFKPRRNSSGQKSPPLDFSDYIPSPPKSRPSSVHDLRSLRIEPFSSIEEYDSVLRSSRSAASKKHKVGRTLLSPPSAGRATYLLPPPPSISYRLQYCDNHRAESMMRIQPNMCFNNQHSNHNNSNHNHNNHNNYNSQNLDSNQRYDAFCDNFSHSSRYGSRTSI